MTRIKKFIICITIFFIYACDFMHDFDEPGNIVPKTVVEDEQLPQIEINGVKLHAETMGDIHNPIMIFLHGGPGGDYRAYISQFGEENASAYPEERTITNGGLSQLQDEYYCIFYDQSGAGLSTRFDRNQIKLSDNVDELDSIISYYIQKKLDETGVTDSQVYIFSWSHGGILSTAYINRYPDRVKDIIMYEPGPFTEEIYEYFKSIMTSNFSQIGYEWLEEYLLAQDHISTDSHERSDYHHIMGSFRNQPEFHQNPDIPFWRFGSYVGIDGDIGDFFGYKYDITDNLSSFEGNALFIAGDLTMASFPDYMPEQMKLFPRCELKTLTGYGHSGVWESPNTVANMTRTFINNQH